MKKKNIVINELKDGDMNLPVIENIHQLASPEAQLNFEAFLKDPNKNCVPNIKPNTAFCIEHKCGYYYGDFDDCMIGEDDVPLTWEKKCEVCLTEILEIPMYRYMYHLLRNDENIVTVTNSLPDVIKNALTPAEHPIASVLEYYGGHSYAKNNKSH